MPWNEALIQMENGKIDGLIGISNAKGKELLTTKLPLEYSIISAFTTNDTKWVYDGPKSLRGKKIGMIMDYEMGEDISNYLSINYAKSTGSFLIEDGELAVSQSIKNLIENKSDVYIEDRRVVKDYLMKNGLEDKIRDSGRIYNTELPIYVAFYKKIPNINRYVKNLENGIASLKATGEYEDLREKYQMDY
jgi:polar amino acid transport system substrate-binding protein